MPTSATAAPAYMKNNAATTWAHYAAQTYRLVPGTMKVLKMIASATDFGTWRRCTYRISLLAELCNVSRSTVNTALKTLRTIGLIAKDGSFARFPDGPRRSPVNYYRLSGTPTTPLPGKVLCARAGHLPGFSTERCVTCTADLYPEAPTTGVVQSVSLPPVTLPAPARSAASVPSGDAHASEPVNAKQQAARVRHEPTAPKGRPTPRRATSQSAAAAPTHGALEPVAHLLDRLTPGQRRIIRRRLATVMAIQRVGTRRMAERLRHWRLEAPDDPMGWLMYAVAAVPHGCADPACENGTLWDPGSDLERGQCRGCLERIHARALSSGVWRGGRADSLEGGSAGTSALEWLSSAILEDSRHAAAVCAGCEAPFGYGLPADGGALCRGCRAEVAADLALV